MEDGTSLGLKLVLTEVVNQEGPPHPGFQIVGQLAQPEKAHVVLLGLSFSVQAGTQWIRVQPDRAIELGSLETQIPPGEKLRVQLPVTFTRETLSMIEQERAGRGEVDFRVYARALIARVVPVAAGNGRQIATVGVPKAVHVQVHGPDERSETFAVPRDKWLALLTTFRYSETEIHELPVQRLKLRGLPPEALEALKAGEGAFRGGDWDGTLMKFRHAFEAIATATVGSEDVAAGFSSLWQKFLPDEIDEPKRKALNDMVRALASLQHLGRHKKFPFTPVDRSDALLALRVSLALFEYMGARA